MIIKFPNRLKCSKENPIVDFYKKCMIQVNGTDRVDNVQVTAFTVNPKDYKKLNELLKKHYKKNYPFLKANKLKFEIGMVMLDIGPRVNKSIAEGFVLVEEDELYGNFEIEVN
jgi:hypothetical protein